MRTPIAAPQRRTMAVNALRELGSHRSDHQQLTVQCARSHHVAGVYATESGLVYVTLPHGHTHGARDRGAPHSAPRGHAHGNGRHGGTEYVDLLRADALSDDSLPAWCDCGPHTLSRAQLAHAIAEHRKTIRLP